MKKVLVVVSFLLTLFMIKNPETVLADNNANSSFAKIKLINRGQMIHVTASINTSSGELNEDDTMSINWQPLSKQLIAQGVKQTRDILVENGNLTSKIGTYTVNTNNVLIQFNKSVEDYKNLTGKINFDIEVNNPTSIKQQLVFSVENNQKLVSIAPNNQSERLLEITGNVDSAGQAIAWKIKLTPPANALESLDLINTLPQGLKLDQASLKILADEQTINLSKNAIKLTQNELNINLSEIDAKTLTVKYSTEILDSAAIDLPNQATLSYQLENKKSVVTGDYQGWAVDNRDPVFSGEYVEKEAKLDIDRPATKNEITHTLTELFRLINDQAKLKVETEDKSKAATTKVAEPVQIKTPDTVSSVRASDAVNQNKKDDENLEESNNSESIATLSESSDQEKDKTDVHSKEELPQAGETATYAKTLMGVIILVAACAVFKIKLHK